MAVSRFIFTGHLTRDAEIETTANGRKLGRIRLAVNKQWTDGEGAKQERASFFNITLWGKIAENAHRYLGKGSQVYVEGEIESSDYERDGQRIFGTDFIASYVDYLNTNAPEQHSTSSR